MGKPIILWRVTRLPLAGLPLMGYVSSFGYQLFRSVPPGPRQESNPFTPWGFRVDTVESDLRNHREIVQPRLYDSILLSTRSLIARWLRSHSSSGPPGGTYAPKTRVPSRGSAESSVRSTVTPVPWHPSRGFRGLRSGPRPPPGAGLQSADLANLKSDGARASDPGPGSAEFRGHSKESQWPDSESDRRSGPRCARRYLPP